MNRNDTLTQKRPDELLNFCLGRHQSNGKGISSILEVNGITFNHASRPVKLCMPTKLVSRKRARIRWATSCFAYPLTSFAKLQYTKTPRYTVHVTLSGRLRNEYQNRVHGNLERVMECIFILPTKVSHSRRAELLTQR